MDESKSLFQDFIPAGEDTGGFGSGFQDFIPESQVQAHNAVPTPTEQLVSEPVVEEQPAVEQPVQPEVPATEEPQAEALPVVDPSSDLQPVVDEGTTV